VNSKLTVSASRLLNFYFSALSQDRLFDGMDCFASGSASFVHQSLIGIRSPLQDIRLFRNIGVGCPIISHVLTQIFATLALSVQNVFIISFTIVLVALLGIS
jgi:hypothetical protein